MMAMSNAERKQLDDALNLVERQGNEIRGYQTAVNRNNEIIHGLNIEKQGLQGEAEAARTSANHFKKRLDQLETDKADLEGALKTSTKLAESLQKEVEWIRNQNTELREQIQRALGYIDRVNEDSKELEPVVEHREHPQQRGPRLNPLGGNYMSAESDSNDFNSSMRRRRY